MKVLIFYGYIIVWLFVFNAHVLEASKKRERDFFDFLSETSSNKKRKLEENKNEDINNNENIDKTAINFLLTPSNTPTYIDNLLNEKDKINKDLAKNESSPAIAMLIELVKQANEKLTKISESNDQLGEQLKKLEKEHKQLKIDFKNYKIEVNHVVNNRGRNQNSYEVEKIKLAKKRTDYVGEDSSETTENNKNIANLVL